MFSIQNFTLNFRVQRAVCEKKVNKTTCINQIKTLLFCSTFALFSPCLLALVFSLLLNSPLAVGLWIELPCVNKIYLSKLLSIQPQADLHRDFCLCFFPIYVIQKPSRRLFEWRPWNKLFQHFSISICQLNNMSIIVECFLFQANQVVQKSF